MAAARPILTGPLADLLASVNFKVLDVGARGGPLAWMTFLAPFAVYYACEPDPDARKKLKNTLLAEGAWKGVIPIAEAFAEVGDSLTLNLTYHPGMTSALIPNPDVISTFGLEQEFTIVGQLEVPAVSLAAAARSYGFEDLALIKLDTQGSELDILRSGRDLLAGPVQGVFVETEFRQVYQDQPLFSEVELFLRRLGFELISLEPVTRRRTNTGLSLGYSRRETAWAHALFVKQAPKAGQVDEDELYRRTVHQIGIAMAREQFDLAAERLVGPDFQAALTRRGLNIGLEMLEAHVRSTVSAALYRDFSEGWKPVVKHRDRYYSG